MKQFLITALSLLTIGALSAQNSPVYVLFNSSCFQQLEYKRVRSGESVFAYSYKANVDEQYVFFSVGTPLPTESLPEGTLDCTTLNITDDAVKIINDQSHARQIYVIVQQRTGGYLMMPITTAVQVKRYGSWYLLVGPKYTFAVDTTNLSYQDNLQSEDSPSIIRFTGSQLNNCLLQYKFHGEPTRGNTEIVDLDFIYGIGVVNLRRGANATELQGSEMRLANVGNQTFDAYLAEICHQPNQQVNTNYNTSAWTNTAYTAEPDKENMSTGGGWQQPAQPANTGWQQQQPSTQTNQIVTGNNFSGTAGAPSGCTTPFGKGYHVVQRGESLKAIARTYNVDLKSIIKWNNIKDPDKIQVCQQIWLQKPPAKSSTTTAKSVAAKSQTTGNTVVNQSNYWSGNQQPTQYNYAPAQYNYAQSGTHLVVKGETLSGISRRYNCPEDCVRRANNMPPQGNVIVKIGQTLTIPQCPCQTTNVAANEPSRTSGPPPQVANTLNPQTKPPAPVVYDYQKEDPNAYNETSVAGQNTGQTTQPRDPNNLPPTQEYIVRQGETINSIAIKHKMSVAELATLNGLKTDDKLTPGKRLVVRQY
jgi:LysM repeat protein